MLRDWIQHQIIVPIVQLLRQGITPEKIALSIAFGAVLGSMPALGVTTTLCFVVAYLLRLNPVAIQLVNYLIYPVQLALLLPFIRAGEIVFGQRHLVITIPQIEHLVKTNLTEAIRLLWTAVWHAVTVWAALAPLAIAIIYICLTPVLRRMAFRSSSERIEI